ncbi:hypothetical protein DCCM_2681 [Desulfocucumis palustris]|uniref:Uncharacterized protein n=1 Tax=Desulfocucumis palustris TaxID=1898651 RepID=A0A2L2XBJ1_9FIRM|nr:CBO0543 family protein [Desulfocucumis palustris]GBF33578.1 hypothetical protein DCCM_2681 [Desulfocucumis palustris]
MRKLREGSPLFEKEFLVQKRADEILRQGWKKETFLTWEWWLLVALTIFPWLIWWKLVDRRRIFEILTYGIMIMIISEFFDGIGVEFDLWEYHQRLIPLFDILIVYDFSVIPVIYMLVYQFFNTWKSFAVASIIVAGIFAFISEPALMAMGFYEVFNWRHVYSFPIYFSMAMSMRWIMGYLKKVAFT